MKSSWPWIAILALYILHQDFWNWDRYKPLILGFVPVGLAYHAAYSVAASILMWMLVRYAWPKQLETEDSAKSNRPNPEVAS